MWKEYRLGTVAMAIVFGLVTAGRHAAQWTNTQTFSTAVGNGADAYVERTAPSTVFSDLEHVTVKNDSGTGNVDRKGYFRIDVSSLLGEVSDATLRFTFHSASVASNGPRTFNVYGLLDGHAGESWVESAVTWNNAPANNTGSGTSLLPGQATFLGTFPIDTSTAVPGTTTQLRSPGLTQFVQADTDGLVTFVVIRQQANLQNEAWVSKEHPFLPPTELDVVTRKKHRFAGGVPVHPGGFVLFPLAWGMKLRAAIDAWRPFGS